MPVPIGTELTGKVILTDLAPAKLSLEMLAYSVCWTFVHFAPINWLIDV